MLLRSDEFLKIRVPHRLLLVIALLSCCSVACAEWVFCLSAGCNVVSTKSNIHNISDRIGRIQQLIYEVPHNLEEALIEDVDSEDHLIQLKALRGTQNRESIQGNFVSGDSKAMGFTESIVGFGRDVQKDGKNVRDVSGVNAAVNEVFEDIYRKLNIILTDENTEVIGSLRFEASPTLISIKDADGNSTGQTAYVRARIGLSRHSTSELLVPMLKIKDTDVRIPIIKQTKHDYNEEYFANPATLATAIGRHLDPNYADIISAYASATKLKSQTRSGMTFGISMAYSHSFFSKEQYECGIYTGVEGFGEFTPKANAGGCKIHEMEVGIRPFVGVEMKEKWRLYALGGVKLRRMHIKSKLFRSTTNKPAFELGIGSEYIISDRYTIGLKVIKTLKQRQKIKGIPFAT